MHQLRRPKNLLLHPKNGPLLTRLMIHMYRLAKEQWPMKFLGSSKRIDFFDAVLVPVGGGRPHFRCFYHIKETEPRIEVIGVEAGRARSMKAAFEAGGPLNYQKSISLQGRDCVCKRWDNWLVLKWPVNMWKPWLGSMKAWFQRLLIDLYSKQRGLWRNQQEQLV